jgi:hypothetical protein
MNWFLLFAMIGANPALVQIEGPFASRAECVRHEYFSTRWCLAGCVQPEQLAGAIFELHNERPSINTAGAYCSNHQIGE